MYSNSYRIWGQVLHVALGEFNSLLAVLQAQHARPDPKSPLCSGAPALRYQIGVMKYPGLFLALPNRLIAGFIPCFQYNPRFVL